eukprot:TRINITY_DN6386_c0_g1_i2.p2 TRINITY_DN6386_c0_g1~~TRINITY_DN6386_c0_g1_i2.p2  ORF type:complete len:102 (+),score=15.54 TRINITY_DN6386_c0_g1_i2:343-648(+)
MTIGRTPADTWLKTIPVLSKLKRLEFIWNGVDTLKFLENWGKFPNVRTLRFTQSIYERFLKYIPRFERLSELWIRGGMLLDISQLYAEGICMTNLKTFSVP